MTSDAGKDKKTVADQNREDGEYEAAAKKYVSAAYEYLGEDGLQHSVSTARALSSLALGALTLRYLEEQERCRNICWQGVHISKAVAQEATSRPRASHSHDQAMRGIWFEFQGDFRAFGELPDVDTAYDRAEAFYEDAGDPWSVSTEQYHMATTVPTKTLVRGVEGPTDELVEALQPHSSLTDWIEFKRSHVPAALERLDIEDDWTYTL